MLNQFSDTIEKIYAAAAGERPWQEALHSVEDLTGSAGAVIGFVPKSPEAMPFNIAGRFTAEQCAIYSAQYQSICRRTTYMIEHPTCEVIYDAMLISEQEMNTDPVYDWLAQHDLRYFIGASLPATQLHNIVFTLQRSPNQGHVQEEDLLLFRQVVVHLGRGLSLSDQLGTLNSFKSFGTTVFQALPQALFALDGHGRLVFANDAAADLMRRSDGVSLSNGRLQAFVPSEQSVLDRLIAEALGMSSSGASGWTTISRRNGKASYAVFVAPLHTGEDELAATAVKVLVIVHDPCVRPSVEPAMLAAVYGLTETEAWLASAITVGHSLESAAASHNMQIATARSHLKSVFAKLHVNRQQDLVRLLMSLSSIDI